MAMMFRLDYLSCFLTVVATILVGRKIWTGLVVSCVNSLIVCVIGMHTSQYGFIPANVFCICINAYNLRAWSKVQKNPSEATTRASRVLIDGYKRISASKKPTMQRYRSAEQTVPIEDADFSHIAWIETNPHVFASVSSHASERVRG